MSELLYALLGAATALVTVAVLSSLALRRHKRRNPMLSLPPMPSPMPTPPYGEPVQPGMKCWERLENINPHSRDVEEIPPCPECGGDGVMRSAPTGYRNEDGYWTCKTCHGTGLTEEDCNIEGLAAKIRREQP